MVCTTRGYGSDKEYIPVVYEKYNNNFNMLEKANQELTEFFYWLEKEDKLYFLLELIFLAEYLSL